MSSNDAVITEQRDRILLITLNRPHVLNAINIDLATRLSAAVEYLDSEPKLAVGVLTGAGRAFSAGMDLKAYSQGEDVKSSFTFVKRGARKPLIAAIEGLALAGGLEIALACDLLVAAKGAKLGIPEVKVGLFAGSGGVIRLPARIGYGKAMEMALTGDPILAEEAAALGLVTRLTEPGEAVKAALELAEKVAQNAPLGVAASKLMIKASQGSTEEELWLLQGPTEAAVVASNDAQEGARAFSGKRSPVWSST
jgi:enoyl-CoA hydratase/carnithine racemase